MNHLNPTFFLAALETNHFLPVGTLSTTCKWKNISAYKLRLGKIDISVNIQILIFQEEYSNQYEVSAPYWGLVSGAY